MTLVRLGRMMVEWRERQATHNLAFWRLNGRTEWRECATRQSGSRAEKREGDRCRSHYDVAAADVISMADHPRTCGTPNSIVASSVLSLSVSIQKPDGVFHVVHLSIHPAALAAALNTQMVWVQTEDNGSEFYAHVLSNYPRMAHVLSKTSVAKRYDTGGVSTSKFL